jgi:hypothetical protein
MEFVVNEWLPEYFRPKASSDEKQKLEHFLNEFLERKDKIFVRRPSEFLRKVFKYSKDYQNNIKTSVEISKFIKIVLKDSERCFFVDDDEFELSDLIHNKLAEGGNTISDKYLFEAASMTATKTIITTDAKLRTFMQDETTFKIELLDDFLMNY